MQRAALNDLAATRSALSTSTVIGALSEAAKDRLIRAGWPVELEPGELLFQRGDVGDAAYVVLQGELEARTQSHEGVDVRLAGLPAGAIAGELAVVDGAPRSADVVAQTRARLWRIPRAALIAILEEDPIASLALLGELAKRLRADNLGFERNRLAGLGERLAEFLIDQRGARDVVAMTQTEMARRLGFSREKINRKLHEWSAAGWLEITRGGVRMIAPERLRQVSGTAL